MSSCTIRAITVKTFASSKTSIFTEFEKKFSDLVQINFSWNRQTGRRIPAFPNKNIFLPIASDRSNAPIRGFAIGLKPNNKIGSVLNEANPWEGMTMIESFGFVEMYLAVPLKLWKNIKYTLVAISEVAVLVGGCA
jgi:hypothetical protein